MKQLQGAMEAITSPKLSAEINFGSKDFSMTAWVRTVPQFLEGYILRKRPSPGSTLSCVGWHLHRILGPGLHYGAHDFDPRVGPFTNTDQDQYEVKLDKAEPFEPEQFALLTMIVSVGKVTFFRNVDELGNSSLPRGGMTDCFNGGEGTLIGDPGLELGVVRYYPFALTKVKIEELFKQGGMLNDISTGTQPEFTDSSQIGTLGRSLGESINQVDLKVRGRTADSQINVILQASSLNPTPATVRSPRGPLGDIPAAITTTNDAGNRPFYQLLIGPYLLDDTSTDTTPNPDRYISNAPSFSGTGATFTYWYRPNCPSGAYCGSYVLLKKNTDRK